MPINVEALTTATLAKALDVTSLRQQAIAANIANASVAGYVPMRVNFETQLATLRESIQSTGTVDAAQLSEMEPRMELRLDSRGQPTEVKLDAEVADMAQNTVHYQALLAGLNRHYGLLSYAVSDGKR